MKKVVTFSVFFIISLSAVLYGMSAKTVVDEMNARYSKIMEKSGGIKITQLIKSIADGSEILSTQIILKKGKKYKIETLSKMDLEEEMTKNVILFDGIDVWFISPFVGITILPRDESMVKGIFDDFSKLIPENSTIVGEEKIDDEDCYIIKTPEDLDVPFSKIWISKTRFVPLKAIGKLGSGEIILTFTDYRKVEGIWGIPYITMTSVGDKPVATVTVESVETGVEIPDETFDVGSE